MQLRIVRYLQTCSDVSDWFAASSKGRRSASLLAWLTANDDFTSAARKWRDAPNAFQLVLSRLSPTMTVRANEPRDEDDIIVERWSW